MDSKKKKKIHVTSHLITTRRNASTDSKRNDSMAPTGTPVLARTGHVEALKSDIPCDD
jgi:hypothetical protein